MTSTSAVSSTPYIPASSPRSADVVLYLDLDGVVHHEAVLWHPRLGIYMSPYQAAGHYLFEWLPLLQEELAPYPQVALVLSSTWCIRPGYAKTLQRLPEQLRTRFIGGTFHKRVHGADPWLLASFRNTLTVTLTYPSQVPQGAKMMKWDGTAWQTFVPDAINNNQVIYTVTDNGPLDTDKTSGLFADPALLAAPLAAPPVVSAAIPALSEWGLIFMSSILAMFGIARMRRRQR